MMCWSLMGWWRLAGGVLALMCAAADCAAQNAGGARADEHGGPSRRAPGPGQEPGRRAVAECDGDRRQRGERRAVHGDDRCPGRLRVRRAAGGQVRRSRSSSAGLTAFRRRGVEVAMDSSRTLDITLDAASRPQAAEVERQELLQKIATLEQRIADLESSAVLVRARDARAARRSVRGSKRQRARRAGVRAPRRP